MELAGKYLIATIKDQSARLLFDLPGAARSDRHWTFVGRVGGETAGVGVWLAIEEIVNPEGMITSAPRVDRDSSADDRETNRPEVGEDRRITEVRRPAGACSRAGAVLHNSYPL